MSYDVSISDGACPHCGRWADHVSWNFTGNGARMWHPAGAHISEWSGQTTEFCAMQLADALATLQRDPVKFRALEPSNGWGTYDQMVLALADLLEMLRKSPGAKVSVSR